MFLEGMVQLPPDFDVFWVEPARFLAFSSKTPGADGAAHALAAPAIAPQQVSQPRGTGAATIPWRVIKLS